MILTHYLEDNQMVKLNEEVQLNFKYYKYKYVDLVNKTSKW